MHTREIKNVSDCERSAIRFLIISLLVALTIVSPTPGAGAPLLSHAAYPGEYVVTLPPRTAGVAGRHVEALDIDSPMGADVTVLRRLNSSAMLVSSGVRSAATPAPERRMGVEALSLISESDGDLFCKRLIASKRVETCSPNYQLSVGAQFSLDPLCDELWGMSDASGIAAASAWEVTSGSADVVVAIIDTGVDYNHPDLADNIWNNPGEVAGNGLDDDGNGYADDIHGVNTSVWASNHSDPFDDNQHGTHVAGTIGAIGDNGIGVAGINQRVKLLPIKFMDSSGSGRLSDAITAIDYMVDLKVNRGVNIRVANNSWGGGAYSAALLAAIERARDAGIIFVVAAGNDGNNLDLFPGYPASYEASNVVSVAAMDRDGNLASFSNYGTDSVDIAAPGVNILSTLPNGQYGYLSGTSMATPHVVGSLALLLGNQPNLSVDEAIKRLYESGQEMPSLVTDDGMGALIATRRMVNANRLVRNITQSVPALDGGLPPCGYRFDTVRLGAGEALDGGADNEPIVNQVDEGGFYKVELPFEFPFFRTKARTVYLSPNGVVYLYQPTSPDYQVAARAPNNSIAAFHTDLTPRGAKQGVRVHRDSDHVTVAWSSEQYSLAGQGPISVRLTLYQTGLIVSSISFEQMTDPTSGSRQVLGDPFEVPAIPALGLIGVSAHSSRLSSTVDIAAAQHALTSGADQRLDLRVTMIPQCFDVPEVETKLTSARIDKINLKLSKNKKMIAATWKGVGSGKMPLTGYVNGIKCPQVGWGQISDGGGRATMNLLAGVKKVRLESGSAFGSVLVRGIASPKGGSDSARLCSRVMKNLIE